jgi:hypothetical protein
MKNELNTCFQQKFATDSYGVGIGHGWCSRKACEICSSLVQKKKWKKNYFSSHKLPKQQSTSFWSQEILEVNHSQGILGIKKCKFFLDLCIIKRPLWLCSTALVLASCSTLQHI